MTHAERHGWSFITGERGRNRVRAYEHPQTGRIFLELYDGGRRKRLALGHRDREAAKAKAEEVAAALRHAETPLRVEPTLQALFDNYGREVTPTKSTSTQGHDRRAMRFFLSCFGLDRKAATLDRRDWDGYIAWRRRGGDRRDGRVKGRPVRSRVVEYDLRFLHAVLNWAVTVRDAAGGFLLDRNPLKGMPWPKGESLVRPVLTDGQYEALLRSAEQESPLCGLALVLAHETGHRIGAIRLLRWSDVDLVRRVIRWRGENDKIGFEHETLLTPEAVTALEAARRVRPAVGDAWLFPAPGPQGGPMSRHRLRDWWERLEVRAGLQEVPRLGWHALRRQFATELKHIPLKDLCHLGGWKNPQTVLMCYQQADEETMREALEGRRRLRGRGTAEVPQGVVVGNPAGNA
jgi:integrase